MLPAASRARLELRDVSKYFGDFAALRQVSLAIAPGEAVLVYGPNGAGKTTLLRTLASLARPTEGHLLFQGEDVHRDPAAARASIGFVSHATFLYGDLTPRENLKFAGALYGLDNLKARVEAALERFGVHERGDEPVRTLSRGLQQRVALARAFLHDPLFLLLDEPFTGLDAASVEILGALLARLPAEGKALIFSTHDFSQGVKLAGRLAAMDKGRLLYDGVLAQAPLESLGITSRTTTA